MKMSIISNDDNSENQNPKYHFCEYRAQDLICEIMCDESVSFRKFGNAFRKHVDSNFRRDMHTKAVGGIVDANFTFEELAGYIIGDGNYRIDQKGFEGFMSCFPEKKIPDNIITKL